MRRVMQRIAVAGLGLVLASTQISAEDVEKKWRFGFFAGAAMPQAQVASDAANVLTLFDRDFEFFDQFIDPRDDSSVFGTLEIRPNPMMKASVQYGVNKIFMVEASIGYTQTEVGQVEVQAQFDQIPVDEDINFNFQTFRIPAGDMTRVPIHLSGMARFRPRASFNPYIGGGIGYSIVGFDPTAEFDALSLNMDRSLGQQAMLSSAIFGSPSLTAVGQSVDLQGATVDAQDTFEWFLRGGAEYSVNRKWAIVFDFTYSFSSRSVNIGFNGGKDLGIAVPFLTDFNDSPAASQTYGAVRITEGGLVDGGSLVPSPQAPLNTDCDVSPINCVFDPTVKDGEVDTGFYYVTGGEIKYDSFDALIGFRFTF